MEKFASLREDRSLILDIDDYAVLENLVIEWYGESINTLFRDWILKDWYGDNGIYLTWDPEVGLESAAITFFEKWKEIALFVEHRGEKGMSDHRTFAPREFLKDHLDHINSTDNGIELCDENNIALLSI